MNTNKDKSTNTNRHSIISNASYPYAGKKQTHTEIQDDFLKKRDQLDSNSTELLKCIYLYKYRHK